MFIAVEGPEGCGKTTLTKRLSEMYRERGLDVLISREPGGTPVGEEFRRVLKDPKHQGSFPKLSELFGFLAARAAFVAGVVKPALDEGKLVLTDRFSLSTMAYQIAGRGLPERECLAAIALAESGVSPYYIALLVDPHIGLRRKADQGDAGDRFALESLDYHQQVHEGYRRYGRRFGAYIVGTDTLSAEQVFRAVQEHLDERFGKKLRALGT